ncbi:MAG: SPW repeat protein [Hyphomicrobium sp.]|uniref:SPW repeat protein n=1 Tax=Hyphomicrobium sp. TaxID=82 RepID=UPI00132AC20D|nr:SPW repeat protein [Hyphomicrobium sp.]KAB2940955.1 MAG: SPW repeat protein [Hyphomicrobium sp.]MBZ0211429.1 SPW repeat protein [Hyphomicrobium sp.]
MNRFSTFWQDTLNLVLGAALLVSPWVLGFASETTPTWNAFIVGAIIAVLALAALFAFQVWEEWVSGALGAWLIIAPWVLGFGTHATALYTHVLIGIATLVLAYWSTSEHGHHMAAGG